MAKGGETVKQVTKLGVIILNYLAYKETINCIDDFLKIDQSHVELMIVVVDNCSPNDSVEILTKEYDGDSRVLIVSTEQNLGFAKGNNFGYQKLIKVFLPDYVVISNDDIRLPDENLLTWIKDMDEKYHFAVLGPSVYSTNAKYYQSPLENFPEEREACLQELKKFKKSLFRVLVKRILGLNSTRVTPKTYQDANYMVVTDKKTLHGSFLVFSKEYFNYYTDPFDSNTFLYMEENILRLRCNIKNLNMIYSPKYKVNHMQAVATSMVNKNQLKRDYVRIQHIINSLKYYITLLEESKR